MDASPAGASLLPVDHFVPVAVPTMSPASPDKLPLADSASPTAALAFIPPEAYAAALQSKVQRGT